jgi:hypothetical protein
MIDISPLELAGKVDGPALRVNPARCENADRFADAAAVPDCSKVVSPKPLP